MAEHEDPAYEVGYGRPPKHSRFKPGQSGNPRGRPKGAKTVGAMLEGVFFQKIWISEKGKRGEITMVEAILRQLANGAAKGEIRHIDRVIKLLPLLQQARSESSRDGDGNEGDPMADRAVLEALAEMFGSDPEDLFATLQGEAGDDRSRS